MTRIEPGDDLLVYHEYSRRPWEENLDHMAEVLEVWKGQFTIVNDVDAAPLEIKQPSEGRAIIKKMNEMLSLNAGRKYSVARFSNDDSEKRRCDRLERSLYAYENDLRTTTGNNVFALEGTLLLIRGKSALHTTYKKNAYLPKVRVELLDPAEYFPVYGDNGISWFTIEKWMTRWELVEFFENLTDKEISKLVNRPDMKKAKDEDGKEYDAELNEELRVIQYWNEDWMAWSVEDTLIQKYNHNWHRMTLREAKLEATPFKDRRWSQEPFLGPISDSLKLKSSLTSKSLNAVQAYYYPRVLAQSESGEVFILPEFPKPGEIDPIGATGKLTVLNAQSNQGELKVLIDLLNNDIAKTTLPDPAWSSSAGDESGFRASLTLNQIKGAVADTRSQIETCDGLALGDVLWFLKKYAPAGGWEMEMLEPDGRNRIQTLTADDIGKHQKVSVTITPALPQDMLQMITNRNMLIARDPLTGMVNTDIESADEATGLADLFGDYNLVNERRQKDLLLTQDPEAKDVYIKWLKVQHSSWLEGMQKDVRRDERKQMKRQVAMTAKDIEEGLTEDVVLPAEILADPQKLNQFVMLVTQQGMMPQDALDNLQDGMPLGVPGEMVAEGMGGQQQQPGGISPETQNILAMLNGQQPNGFTGYEGVNPMAAPAAMMGAQPRPALDQPALQVEAVETLQRRGAKPAAR